MTKEFNNLKKSLKKFAKNNKTVKYSQALLIVFLISGGLAIANETDIGKVANQIKIKESKKKLGTSRIELLQSGEQEDQIVKSSWSFSADYTYTDMGGMIKGIDDKADIYKDRYTLGTNGRLMRKLDADGNNQWWLSKVVPGSRAHALNVAKNAYDTLGGTSLSSLDSNDRNQYGITKTNAVYDQPAKIATTASITPKIPNAPNMVVTVKDPTAVLPPETGVRVKPLTAPTFFGLSVIEFQPSIPNLIAPTPIMVNPISLFFGSVPNDDYYWFPGRNPSGTSNNSNAVIAQYSMDTANPTNGKGVFESIATGMAMGAGTFTHYINNTSMNAYQGGHTTIVGGELRTENNTRHTRNVLFASMNLVGGEIIPITNMEITHLRESIANLALFHIDAHNDFGSSIWALDNTNVTLKGNNAILFNIQYHGGSGDAGMSFDNGVIRADSSTSYTSTYNGTTYNSLIPGKRYIFATIQAIGGSLRHLFFRNEANGNIYLNGEGDTLANLAANVNDGDGFGGSYIENRGHIELNGVGSMGIVIAPTLTMANGLQRSWIRFEEPLILNGDRSVGVAFTRNFNTNASVGAGAAPVLNANFEMQETKNSILKITIGERANGVDSGGEAANGDDTSIIGHTPTLVEEATALYFNNGSIIKTPYVIEEIQLKVLQYAKKATLITLIDGNVTLNNSVAGNILNINGGTTKTGIENIAIYVGPTVITNATLVNKVPITVTNSDLSMAIFGQRANITNNGSITIAGSNGVKGVIADASSNITITGNVTLTDGGVYTNSANRKIGSVVLGTVSGSTLNVSGTVTADVLGQESIGLYANNSILSLTGTASNIKASDGALVMTAINNGHIEYAGNTLEAGQKSLLFYLDNTSDIKIQGVTTGTIKGSSDATERGTAFYYKSVVPYGTFGTTEINSYFANRFAGTMGNLTLNMEEGSRLFIADSVSMNLTNTNLSMGGVMGAPNINPLGTYKSFMLYKSDLIIDKPVDLDLVNDDYRKLEIIGSKITNMSSVSGIGIGQVAIAQQNGLDASGALETIGTVTLTNNGVINLSGTNSTGMYASHGIINNTNTLSVGDKSLGIYSIKGTQISNTGTINIGNDSVGIYATNDNKLNPSNPALAIGTIDVTNNGSIISTGTTKGFGIYIDNYDISVPVANSTLKISGNTNIDLSSITNASVLGDAVGIYVSRTKVHRIGAGTTITITVGKNGIGIIADKQSNIGMNGMILNLKGDNAVGIQALNGSTYFGVGTINVDGQNITLFMMDANIGTSLSQGFDVRVTPGSTYTYGNLADSIIVIESISTMGAGKTFLNGKNTVAYYRGAGASVTSLGNGSIGMALDGKYTAMPSYPTALETVIITDGTNGGTISLKDYSIGMYAKNGAGLLNDIEGNIRVGENSAGIFVDTGTGIEIATNRNNITVGSNSIGLYGVNVGIISNEANATIESLGNTSVVGMRSNSVYSTSIVNDGRINLSGDNLIGIYSEGSTVKTIINSGNINISNNIESYSNIGIYSKDKIDNIINNRNITVGNAGIAIYGKNTILSATSNITVGTNGIAIYSEGGAINLNAGASFTIGAGGTIVNGKNGVQITDNATPSIGNKSFGFILDGNGVASYINTGTLGNVTVGTNSIYIYSNTGSHSQITNNANILIQGNESATIYGNATDVITNNGTIDLSNGTNNLGIYSNGGQIKNNGTGVITVGAGINDGYGIGLGAENGATLTNNAPIHLVGDRSIGIFANNGAIITNTGSIHLAPTGSTSQMIGIYADKNSTVTNWGNITTAMDYTGHGDKSGIYAMVIKGGSTLENYGNITIQADNSGGVYLDKATIKNYGNITVQSSNNSSSGLIYIPNSKTEGINGTIQKGSEAGNVNGTITGGQTGTIDTYAAIDPSATGKQIGDIEFKKNNAGEMVAYVNGVEQTTKNISYTGVANNIGESSIGIYIDTLGNTNPINDPNGNFLGSNSNSIIIGAEAATKTDSKTILVEDGVTNRFLDPRYQNANYDGGIYSGSLLWTATLVYDSVKGYDRVLMQKRKFTEFSGNQNVYNFADGIDELYETALGTKDKEVFNKLNDIGANEEKLLFQAYDEMMGQPYANVQQRVMALGNLIDKGIDNLFRWDTASKQSNKVQAIGGRSNYKTNTAGVVDYKQTSGGVVYLNEHETVKLGNASGWYAGLLQSRFDFDDIGESKEDATIGKMGVYKSTSFDNNDSLNWKIKGDVSAGYHKMNRKFLVVDEIYNAKGDYYSYGINVTNEISKDFRVSKNVKIGALASLELGYGQFTDIKEDKGEIKLEVKGNDYYSIKPAMGGRISFDKKMGTALIFKTELLAVVEQELGKVTNVENQAKVTNTTADYFNLRKDKREKTNGKVGLNLELGNSRFGFNINGEYNTEGENSQIGAGFKFMF